MKPFLTWLTLGAILFLCSCQESNYRARIYRPAKLNLQTEKQLQTTQPIISYSSEIDTFYNNRFELSFEEDLRAFYDKVDACTVQMVHDAGKLTADTVFRALSILNDPDGAEDISAAGQLAMHIERSY